MFQPEWSWDITNPNPQTETEDNISNSLLKTSIQSIFIEVIFIYKACFYTPETRANVSKLHNGKSKRLFYLFFMVGILILVSI